LVDDIRYLPVADIVKTEKTASGTLLVYGRAGGETLDLDGQGLDMDWLGRELPEWFKTGANVREMHQPIAAGVGRELELKDEAYYVLSEAVDPVTITKLEKGVLTGYSVGIKRPQAMKDARFPNGRIVGGKIIELSYADRAADPLNKVGILTKAAKVDGAAAEVLEETGVAKVLDADLVKKDYSTEQRVALAKEGKAMPVKNDKGEIVDGRYPIDNRGDLENAISAYGRGDPADKPAIKAHIIKNAKALDATDLLPADWPGSTKGDQQKAAAPDKAKGEGWDAAMAGEVVGGLRALRSQLGYDTLQGTDAMLAAILDALLSMAWNEEAEEVAEIDGDPSDMVLCIAHPDVGKRTFYSTDEKDRIRKMMQSIIDAVQGVFPDIIERPPAPAPEADDQVVEQNELTGSPDAVAGSQKAAGAAAPAGAQDQGEGPAPDVSKLATADQLKLAVADAVKAALEDGLKPVKEELARQAEEIGKLGEQPAMPKAVTKSVDRDSAVNSQIELDPVSALASLRDKHQAMADEAGDPVMRQAHLSKIADIDRAITAASQR
jgi:hypothetical protein